IIIKNPGITAITVSPPVYGYRGPQVTTATVLTNAGSIGSFVLDMSFGVSAVPQDTFALSTDGSGGAVVAVEHGHCFAENTLIRTDVGDIAVQELRPGMLVVSAFGGVVPVVWVGVRRVACSAHPKPASVMPVRIRRNAFGPGRPARDLRVSPDHAI